MAEPREVCRTCVFFDGSDCEIRFEDSIVTDPLSKAESCAVKIDRFNGNDPRRKYLWTCCGGILLDKEEKCSVCGEKYEE